MKIPDIQRQQNIYPVHHNDIVKPRDQNAKVSRRVLRTKSKTNTFDTSFSDILGDKIKQGRDIKFSGHAMRRIDERRINISNLDLSRLESGIERVERKGARNSLILIDDTAYIVSVRNKTVVTALTKEAALGNVFTNIDSVAIV